MGLIKNFSSLASSENRKIALKLVETALTAIQPDNIMRNNFALNHDTLKVKNESINLSHFQRIFLIGFGKGSAGISQIIEATLHHKLTDGYVIDTVRQDFNKIHFTQGTHPLPSQANIDFTNTVLSHTSNLTEKDLILIVICGGGSVMFEKPHTLSLEELINLNRELLRCGATISEINAIRKHLSKVKGGGFAKHLFPAKIVSLLFSDVPGNDLSVIASGPTVYDPTTLENVKNILVKYPTLRAQGNVYKETPKETKIFSNVKNILMVSNVTALSAMENEANKSGLTVRIYSDRLQGEAKELGKKLINETKNNEILLSGGESTTVVKGKGKGGRNQALVLAALEYVGTNSTIACFDSDGWDFTTFAGAIGDSLTLEKANKLGLNIKTYLDNDDSTTFFEKEGDGILTEKLESNVSDLMIVIKK